MRDARLLPAPYLVPDLIGYQPAFSAVALRHDELVDHHQGGLREPGVAGESGIGACYPGFWRDLLRADERALGVVEHMCGQRYGLVELNAKVRENIRGQHFEHRDPAIQARQLFVGHRIILRVVAGIKAALLGRVE